MKKRQRLTRKQSQEQTQRHLLDAAIELFLEKGFARSSVEEIAERAGYSKGAIYSNFSSKEELALAVLERRGDEQLERFSTVLMAQGGDATFWHGEATSGAEGVWEILKMELWVQALYDESLRQRLAVQDEQIREAAARILSGGAEPTPQQRDAVTLVIALSSGLALQYTVSQDPHLFELWATFAARLFNELPPHQK